MISPHVKFSGRYLIAYLGYAALVHVKITTLKLNSSVESKPKFYPKQQQEQKLPFFVSVTEI